MGPTAVSMLHAEIQGATFPYTPAQLSHLTSVSSPTMSLYRLFVSSITPYMLSCDFPLVLPMGPYLSSAPSS